MTLASNLPVATSFYCDWLPCLRPVHVLRLLRWLCETQTHEMMKHVYGDAVHSVMFSLSDSKLVGSQQMMIRMLGKP